MRRKSPERRTGLVGSGAVNVLFAAPALLLFGTFVLWPLGASVSFALTNWDGYNVPHWIGFDNFTRAFRDLSYLWSYAHVTIYVLATLLFEVTFGLFAALLMNSSKPGYSLFRTLFFSPVVLSWTAAGLLWTFVLDYRTGLVNATLRALGLGSLAHPWLSDPVTALIALSLVSGWKYSGFYMIIFFAAIRRIPQDVYEAATIDGASTWQQVISITVPLIRSNALVCVLFAVTGGYSAFDLFFTMTNGQPNGATDVPVTWILKQGIAQNQIGYGAALTLILVVIIAGIAAIYSRSTDRLRVTQY